MINRTKSPLDFGNRLEEIAPDSHSSASGVSRRDFLKGSGLLIVGFSMAGVAEAAGVRAGSVAGDAGPAADVLTDIPIDQVDSYLAIAKDGGVTVFTGRMDMGTGNRTCFTQFVADELDVAIERIRVIAGDTGLTPDGGKTTASDAIPIGGQPLRVSAAVARKKLLELASVRLGAPVSQLAVSNGVVSVRSDPTKSVSYGDLIGDQHFNIKLTVDQITQSGPLLKIPDGVTLKTPDQFNYIGKSIPRFDMPDRIIRGAFCQNIRLPGMLHGRMVMPPAVGATLISVDEGSVKGLPGLVKIVVKANFVGVVCEREEQAIEVMKKLKTKWTDGTGLPEYKDLFTAVRRQPLDDRPGVSPNRTLTNQGNVELALASAAKTFKATYEVPYESHALFGPNCGVADVRKDSATIWSGSQWPRMTQKDIALLLGLPTESVRVIWVEESGSYGRLAAADAAADAALLSQAVGRPVRVQWMRDQEFQWQPHSTPFIYDFRVGVDAQGKIIAWDVEEWVTNTRDAAYGKLLAQLHTGTAPGNLEVSGTNAANGGYTFANVRALAHLVKPLTARGLYLRSPGGFQSNFGYESLMDEIAASQGVDPIQFRQRYMTDARNLAVLQAAANRFGWDPRPSPKSGNTGTVVTGRGVALAGGGTRVATVAEVEVNRDTGVVRVRRMAVAHDCGLIVNPDGLLNQVQQATLQGVSRTLKEELTFDRTKITSVDWVTYPILRFSEIPTVVVDLINQPNLAAQGAGEPATTPTAAAIGNAIFDAIGVRMRRLPFTPERVKAALSQR